MEKHENKENNDIILTNKQKHLKTKEKKMKKRKQIKKNKEKRNNMKKRNKV